MALGLCAVAVVAGVTWVFGPWALVLSGLILAAVIALAVPLKED